METNNNSLKLDDSVRAAMGYEAMDEAREALTNAAIIDRNALEASLGVYAEARAACVSALKDFEEAGAAWADFEEAWAACDALDEAREALTNAAIITRKALNSSRETYAAAYDAALIAYKAKDISS